MFDDTSEEMETTTDPSTTTIQAPVPPVSWPPWEPLKRGFPKNSLLTNMEPLVWRALGTLSSELEAYSKQIALREALRKLGLGWIATNTTPYRIAVGQLYDRALAQVREQEQKTENNQSTPTTTSSSSSSSMNTRMSTSTSDDITNHHENSPSSNKRTKWTVKPLPAIDIITVTLDSCSVFEKPFVDEHLKSKSQTRKISKEQRHAVWKELHNSGVCIIRKAIPLEACSLIASNTEDSKNPEKKSSTSLSETLGNGVGGTPTSMYRDLSNSESSQLADLEDILWDILTGETGSECNRRGCRSSRKNILLQYGLGAENWAHQDNNRQEDVPVQAVLLTSQPGKDFRGGEFYVACRDDENTTNLSCAKAFVIRRHVASWENAGDLILFMAGKESGWFHGMMSVQPEAGNNMSSQGDESLNHSQSDDKFAREAIGMLQPV